MALSEDVLKILADPTAVGLLGSRIPARLAYRGIDGTPRVQPIWFHWNGEAFILGTGPATPKVRAIERDPAVALTIDSERPPYRSLQIRGTATIDIVPGIPPEYAAAAERYYGEAVGRRWVERGRRRPRRVGPHRHRAGVGPFGRHGKPLARPVPRPAG